MSRGDQPRCTTCSQRRCLCVAIARMRAVAAEWNAAEVVIERARALVALEEVDLYTPGHASDLRAALAAYDELVEARGA